MALLVKLSPVEREDILDKLVPMIASDEDQDFFRGIISIILEESSSAGARSFIGNLLALAAEPSA